MAARPQSKCKLCPNQLDSQNPNHILCIACGERQKVERSANMAEKACVTCGKAFSHHNPAIVECKKCFDKARKPLPQPARGPNQCKYSGCDLPLVQDKQKLRVCEVHDKCQHCAQPCEDRQNARLCKTHGDEKRAQRQATNKAKRGKRASGLLKPTDEPASSPASDGPASSSTSRRVDTGSPFILPQSAYARGSGSEEDPMGGYAASPHDPRHDPRDVARRQRKKKQQAIAKRDQGKADRRQELATKQRSKLEDQEFLLLLDLETLENQSQRSVQEEAKLQALQAKHNALKVDLAAVAAPRGRVHVIDKRKQKRRED